MIDFRRAIHLVYKYSAKYCLMNYFETNYPNDKIRIHYTEYFAAIGPLSDMISHSNYEEYISFMKNIDYKEEKIENDYEDSLLLSFSFGLKVDFPKDYPLIIWHGSEINEKLLLYRYCSLLKNRDLY